MFRYLSQFVILILPFALNAQPKEEVRAVIAFIEQIQRLSFEHNREYCGYVGWGSSGDLTFTRPVRGRTNSCTPLEPPDNITVFASYHTHGAFGLDVPAEFPTVLDMESDEDEGIDGYIATPGGRLWYVDTEAMEVYQVCGIGCVLQDPEFRPGLDGKIEEKYTYKALKVLESEL
ncbi:MAG: DUF4329 domain-containing protein [Paracoccaceae bacterium]